MITQFTTTLARKAPQVARPLEWLLTGDRWVSLLLFAGAFLMRFPFHTQVLYHWDSVNFAYAIQDFNIAKEQPQPPGYIVFVGLSWLTNLLFHDPQTTLVVISMLAGSLSVVVLYQLGKTMFGTRAGLVAAVLLASSPLFWFYSEIALPHTLDTLLILIGVLACYQARQGNRKSLFAAVLVISIAGGIRQQTLVFLLPLLVYALARFPLRDWLWAGIMGIGVCLAWFLPLAAMSGGVDGYFSIMGGFAGRFQDTTSVLMGAGMTGIAHNLRKLAEYTGYAWNLAFIPVLLAAVLWIKRPSRIDLQKFLALWVLPAGLFYALIHMGQQGLIFVYFPALLLISGAAIQALFNTYPRLLMAATVGLIGVNLFMFLALPEYPLGDQGPRFLNRNALGNSDAYYGEKIRLIQSELAPETTALVAVNWRHVEYYLPAYPLIRLDSDVRAGKLIAPLTLHPGAATTQNELEGEVALRPEWTQLVIFDPVLQGMIQLADPSQFTRLGPEGLAIFHLRPGDRLIYRSGGFSLVSDQANRPGTP